MKNVKLKIIIIIIVLDLTKTKAPGDARALDFKIFKDP